ncbi:MAG: putative sulfate exporter family transporter [Bacilli bacterium]
MEKIRRILPGILLCIMISIISVLINNILPIDLIGIALIALLIGMLLNPIVSKYELFNQGINWTSKRILRIGIILAGITLSFSEVFKVGKYALILMVFTLTTAFGVGYLCRKTFKVNWKLSSLLSVSTAICGGTAVATLGPVIEAENKDIAYSLSATFIFDLLTVIAFPWIGLMIGLSDTSYGLWVGTAVNDTSSVVAAGYAFSEAAGSLATIVKLTRTLFIVPIVLIFSWIYSRSNKKNDSNAVKQKISIKKIFPWFILGFLGFVAIRSSDLLDINTVDSISYLSKFMLATALAAIGLKTSFREVKGVGIKPMIVGVIIDISVVIVSLFAQGLILYFVK